MVSDLLSMWSAGTTAGSIADALNRKYKKNLKKQAVFDKLNHLRESGVDTSRSSLRDASAQEETIAPVSEATISKAEQGETVEVGSEYSSANGLFTKTVIRRPFSRKEKETPASLLTALGFNPNVVTLKTFKESAWQAQGKNGRVVDLTSVRYSVEYRENDLSWDKLSEMVQKAKSQPGCFCAVADTPRRAKVNTLLIPIADLHYGLYSDSYNTKLAEKRVEKTIVEAIDFGNGMGDITKIILVIGNDFFNSDTVQGTTVKGTPQDQENCETKGLFEPAFQMITSAINTLSEVAPVTVLSVSSNHDELSTYHLMVGLRALYSKWQPPRNHEVDVIFDTRPRTYLEFGQTLIGFAHDYKQKDVIGLMASEVPELWGRAKNKYFFLAHLHKEITMEDVYGLGIHRLPTISGKSKWSVAQGYVGTREQNKVYLFSDKDGLIGEWYVHA